MRYVKPTLIFVALAAAVSCAKHPPTPLALPATPAPSVDADRRAALALLRKQLETRTPRSRVRLPADAHIRLAARGARTYAFTTAWYEYVPAASFPYVYQATGAIDLRAGRVTVTALTAAPATPTATPDPAASPAPPVVGPVTVVLDPVPRMPRGRVPRAGARSQAPTPRP